MRRYKSKLSFLKYSKVLVFFLLIYFAYKTYDLSGKLKFLEANLKEITLNYEKLQEDCPNQCRSPTKVYEIKRRRIRTTLQLLWKDLLVKMEQLKLSESAIRILKKSIYEHKISILSDWQEMTLNDGYETWRQKAWMKLDKRIQTRFQKLQNPRECNSTRVLRSTAGVKTCGWGCQFIEYMDKFAVAYATKSLLYYTKPKNQFYEPDELELYYKPLSEKCNYSDPNLKADQWPGNENSTIIESPASFRDMGLLYHINSHALPSDIAEIAEILFEDPYIWWAGQLNKYLLRLNERTEKILNDTLSQLNFTKPIVGIHIRRGNKATEIDNREVEEYMEVADEYFDILELTQKVEKRRVYIVTDEPAIFEEVRTKFPHYEILTNENVAGTAQKYESQKASALGVIIEGYIMSKCDYLVCTLSSNLGRRYYEYLYWNYRDATERMTSLDFHVYEDKEFHSFIALMSHNRTSKLEISIEVGDEIISNFVDWVVDYYIYGTNIRTRQRGYVPKYKLQRKLTTFEYSP